MQMSLKKASECARLAIEKASKAKVPTTLRLSVFSARTPAQAVEDAKREADDTLAGVRSLYAAAYALRAALGRANAECGVADRLAEIARDEAVAKRLVALAGTGGREEDPVLDAIIAPVETVDLGAEAGRMEAMRIGYRSGDRGGFGADTAIDLPVHDAAARKAFEREAMALRRRSAALRDEITERNFGTTIEIDPATAETLRRHGIID